MLDEITAGFRHHPEITLFLVLALGHLLGRLRFGPVELGGTCGTLIVALLIGQFGVHVDDGIKNIFFMLFIFALGYASGPQFFANLNAKGLRLGLLCLVEIVVVVALVLSATYILKLDPGTAAGLLAGSATESAVVGTATDAISRLALPASDIRQLQANVVTAYSITYIFGLISIVVVTSQIFPLLLRINLREEATRLWKALGGDEDQDTSSATPEMVGRLFHVTTGADHTISELLGPFGRKAYIAEVTRTGIKVPVTPDLRLQVGDEVLVIGRRTAMVRLVALIGIEAADTHERNVIVETAQAVLTQNEWSNRTLQSLETALPADAQVLGVTRNGQTMPSLPGIKLQLGDILQLHSLSSSMPQALAIVGERVMYSARTNISFMALGIVLGVYIGGFGLSAAGVVLSLGTGGGALLTGLAFGWYQAKNPHRLSIPSDALALMKDLGLATFIACVGLSSGPQALALIAKFGVALPLVGIAIAVVPATISLFVGHRLLRLDAPILLGAIAGQQCSTPALSAIQNAAGNSTPLLGYTITYAISNATLPLLGPLIVALAGSITIAS